ncbi:MAG: sugar nucleotide-binding protein, partial [Oribacterium parvum]|nr:sugar nucleotide-binding protein [Oribacterium parvum]
MKVFVTGVNGQLGHDVMNSLYYAEIDAIGSDIKESYSGVQDGSPACTMPYIGLDLTDEEKTRKVIAEEGINAIIHCAAWTAG